MRALGGVWNRREAKEYIEPEWKGLPVICPKCMGMTTSRGMYCSLCDGTGGVYLLEGADWRQANPRWGWEQALAWAGKGGDARPPDEGDAS